MPAYRAIALAAAVAFAVVGLMFVFAPHAVIRAVAAGASLSGLPGMPAADADSSLFRALTGAYMYVVALLAWMTYRRPDDRVFPGLLAHAKIASALLCAALFVAHAPYFVYVLNAVVDGFIGAGAVVLLRAQRARHSRSAAVDDRR